MGGGEGGRRALLFECIMLLGDAVFAVQRPPRFHIDLNLVSAGTLRAKIALGCTHFA